MMGIKDDPEGYQNESDICSPLRLLGNMSNPVKCLCDLVNRIIAGCLRLTMGSDTLRV
jgi:hypothetical protein